MGELRTRRTRKKVQAEQDGMVGHGAIIGSMSAVVKSSQGVRAETDDDGAQRG